MHRADAAAMAAGLSGALCVLASRTGFADAIHPAALAFPVAGYILRSRLSRFAMAVAILAVPAGLTALAVKRLDIHDLSAPFFLFSFIFSAGALRGIAISHPAFGEFAAALNSHGSLRRYVFVSAGTALQCITLLIGGLQFFSALFEGRDNARTVSDTNRTAIIAALYGYLLVPALSPIALPFLVVSSLIPQADWLAAAGPLAVVSLIIWSCGGLQFASMNGLAPRQAGTGRVRFRRSAWIVLAVATGPVAAALGLQWLTGLRLADCALMAILAVAAIWTAVEPGRIADVAEGLFSGINEAVIICCSLVLGLAVLAFVPDNPDLRIPGLLATAGPLLPAAIIGFFMIGGQFGVQPSICFVIVLPFAEHMLDNPATNLAVLVAAMIAGWTLNALTSPVGVPFLMVARAIGRDRRQIWKRNLAFGSLAGVLSAAFLSLLA